jgi:hypothetical protein
MKKASASHLLAGLLFPFCGYSQVPYPYPIVKTVTYVSDIHSIPPPLVEKYRPKGALVLGKRISAAQYDSICSYKFTYNGSLIQSIVMYNQGQDSAASRTYFSYDDARRIQALNRGSLIDSFFYDGRGNPIRHKLSTGPVPYKTSHTDTITYIYDQFSRVVTCFTTVPHMGYRRYDYTYGNSEQLQPVSISCNGPDNEVISGSFRFNNIKWSGKNYTQMVSNPFVHNRDEFSSYSFDMAYNDGHAIPHLRHDRDVINAFSNSGIVSSTKYWNQTSIIFDTVYYSKYSDYIDNSSLPFNLDYYPNGKLSSFLSTRIYSWSSCDGLPLPPDDTLCTILHYFYDPADLKSQSPNPDITKITVYPNPSRGEFQFIGLDEYSTVEYEVFTMFGALIRTGTIRGTDVLDLSGTTEGMLVLKIGLENQHIYKKLVVER